MTLLTPNMVFSLLIVVFILPIVGRLQPKIGTINLFPQCGFNKLILLKIMKRLILLVLVSLFYNSSAWAGACNTTITEDHGNSTLGCADNDELTVNEDITFERDNNVVINANTVWFNY